MILLFFELYVSLMTFFMLREHYGIHLAYQDPKEDSRGARQEEWDLDFHGH